MLFCTAVFKVIVNGTRVTIDNRRVNYDSKYFFNAVVQHCNTLSQYTVSVTLSFVLDIGWITELTTISARSSTSRSVW